MRKFEKFLFFYGIAATTALFVSFGIFSPKPANFISLVLITPILFYFWIKLTSPESVSAEKWSFRFLITLMLIASLLVFGYYLAAKGIDSLQKINEATALEGKLAASDALNRTLSQSLASVSAELGRIKSGGSTNTDGPSVTDLVFGSPSPIPLQELTGKAGVKLINVYESPVTSAKKIATLDGTQTYLYLEKQNSWYKVVLSGSSVGWVSGSQVQEVSN